MSTLSASSPGAPPVDHERHVHGLGSAVHESPRQFQEATHSRSNYFKGISVSGDEISETALGEGFSFGFKQPPRPGQFSERPRGQTSDVTQVTPPSPLPARQTVRGSVSAKLLGSAVTPKGPPLPLHELSLPNSQHISPRLPRQDFCETNSPRASHIEKVQTPLAKATPRAILEDRPSSARASQKLDQPVEHQEEAGHILRSLLPVSTPAETSHDADVAKSPMDRAASNNHRRDRGGTFPSVSREQAHWPDMKTSEKSGENEFHVQSRSSPPSACGDLERPLQPGPRKLERSTTRRPAQLRASLHRDMLPRHRSESRTSNVSKKRTDAHRPRLQHDGQRKMLAMHQVAQYWNECIQIAEEEKNQANWEIDRLQHRLQRQDLALSESRSLLKKKQCALEDAERHCHELEQGASNMSSENQRLTCEAESLRTQLSESQTRAEELRAKHRQIRDKLNEAIQEQQDLYKRSQAFYHDSMSELRKENEKRSAESAKIDDALEKGRQKREELMRCFQDLRMQSDRENKLKEETIAELRSRIKAQDETICHERGVGESLRQQIDLQETTKRAMENVASQVQCLVQDCTDRNSDEHGSWSAVNQINERLDALAQHMQATEANNQALPALMHAVQGIGEALSTQLSVIADVACYQEHAKQTILGFGFTCGRELADIKGMLRDQNDNCAASQAFEEEHKARLQDALESLQSRVQTSQGFLQRVEQALEDRFRLETGLREDEIQKRQFDFETKLTRRDERVSHLEQQLVLTSEKYAAKVEALTKDRAFNIDVVPEALLKLFTAFRSNLEEGLLEERERSEKHLRKTQTALAALESQLRAVNDHLAVAKSSESRDGHGSNKNDGNALVCQLQQQVRDLEQQGKTSEGLRDRWQRDIHAVDALRAQLQQIQEKVPQMDRLGATLSEIARVNDVMHSTAQYLTHERDWVRKQLETSKAADHGDDDQSADESYSSHQIMRSATADGLVASFEVESLTTKVNPDAGLKTTEVAPLFRRKVTVHSPAGEFLSPSPPPSVHQEQVRRRGAAQPRSILKLSVGCSRDSAGLPEQGVGIDPDQSQHNRTMASRDSVTMSSTVVEQIRAELVPQQRSCLAWSLPSVADFERCARAASPHDDKSTGGTKRGLQDSDDLSGLGGKRVRINADVSVQAEDVDIQQS